MENLVIPRSDLSALLEKESFHLLPLLDLLPVDSSAVAAMHAENLELVGQSSI